jgi:chromosome segregation ATPase
VRHFEELAVRNSELGRHAAAAVYEEQLSTLAAEVQQYAARCAVLEESHRATHVPQQPQTEAAAAPALGAVGLTPGALQSDGATQTAQEIVAPVVHASRVVSTTDTGTGTGCSDFSAEAANQHPEVSRQGIAMQTDETAAPEVQDGCTETDAPASAATVVSLESTIRSLRVQVDTMQADRDAFAATRESLEVALAELRAELSAHQADAERHSAERDDLLEEIEGLREELARRCAQVQALMDELAARPAAVLPSAEQPPSAVLEHASVLELARLQSVVQELQQQAEQEQNTRADLIQHLQTDLAAADSRVLALTSELAAVSVAAASANQARMDSNQLGADAAHVTALDGQITSLTAQLAAERAEAAAACQTLEAEVRSLTAQLALHSAVATRADSSEHGNREAELHLAVSAAASDLAESRQQLMEKNRLLIEAEAQLWHQQKLSELLEKRIATQDVHCSELERARAELTAQLHAAEHRLIEERAAHQLSVTPAAPRQVVTMTDTAVETEAERPQPTQQDFHQHSTAVSAEPAGDHPAHVLEHAPTPLRFLLPREFLDMTASLQIQMEAVKNISALVVENLKGMGFSLQVPSCFMCYRMHQRVAQSTVRHVLCGAV